MIGFLAQISPSGGDAAVTADDLAKLIEALTPLLQGPTAGLVTVLVLVLGIGWAVTTQFLPAWRSAQDLKNRSLERQNDLQEKTALILQAVQSAMEDLADRFEHTHTHTHLRLEKLEDRVADVVKEVAGMRRDAKTQGKVP